MNRHGWKDLFNSWWFDSSFSKKIIQCDWNILLRSNLAQNHFTESKRELKSKIPKKFLEMIAQRREKTTPGSANTWDILWVIVKGPCYSYSNYLNRFLFLFAVSLFVWSSLCVTFSAFTVSSIFPERKRRCVSTDGFFDFLSNWNSHLKLNWHNYNPIERKSGDENG